MKRFFNCFALAVSVRMFLGGEALLAEDFEKLNQLALEIEERLAEVTVDNSVENLNEKYRGYLENQKKAFQEAGNLKGFLAVEEEFKSFTTESEGQLSPFQELSRLQAIYRDQKVRLENVLAEKKLGIIRDYQESVTGLTKVYTQEGRIEEAKFTAALSEKLTAMENDLSETIASHEPPAAVVPASNSEPATLGELDSDLFVNSLGMRFVPVPISGGPTDTRRSDKEILFCIWETRVKDYRAFESEFPNHAVTKPDWPQTGDHPIVNLGRDDILAFCEWLTDYDQKNGKITEEQKYRLPSDHEWSCAVGIGRDEDFSLLPSQKPRLEQIYPWGNDWPVPEKGGNYHGEENLTNAPQHEIIKGINDGFVRTAPVGSFGPNRLGIFDLGGNVRELVSDWYSDQKNRVVFRGGSWRDFNIGALQSSYRCDNEIARGHFFGFRCVLERSQ